MTTPTRKYNEWRDSHDVFAPTFQECFIAGYEAYRRTDGWRRERAERALEEIYEIVYGKEHEGLLMTQSEIRDMIDRISNPDYEYDNYDGGRI